MSQIFMHRHHVIPRHMGGTDDPDNLVELSIPEHAEAHRKLFEEHGRWQDEIAWKVLSGQMTNYDAQQAARRLANIGNKHFEGKTHTPEVRGRISRGNSIAKLGNQYRKDKQHTEKTKVEISEALMGNTNKLGKTGYTLSDEFKENCRERMTGENNVAKREDVRQIISEKATGKGNAMYGKYGEDNPNYGKTRSEEQKKGMSIAKKKAIEEQKANGTYGDTLKYKNIVISDPDGNIINVPLDYNTFFNAIPLSQFMSKCIKKPGKKIKGYGLVSYELNNINK